MNTLIAPIPLLTPTNVNATLNWPHATLSSHKTERPSPGKGVGRVFFGCSLSFSAHEVQIAQQGIACHPPPGRFFEIAQAFIAGMVGAALVLVGVLVAVFVAYRQRVPAGKGLLY